MVMSHDNDGFIRLAEDAEFVRDGLKLKEISRRGEIASTSYERSEFEGGQNVKIPGSPIDVNTNKLNSDMDNPEVPAGSHGWGRMPGRQGNSSTRPPVVDYGVPDDAADVEPEDVFEFGMAILPNNVDGSNPQALATPTTAVGAVILVSVPPWQATDQEPALSAIENIENSPLTAATNESITAETEQGLSENARTYLSLSSSPTTFESVTEDNGGQLTGDMTFWISSLDDNTSGAKQTSSVCTGNLSQGQNIVTVSNDDTTADSCELVSLSVHGDKIPSQSNKAPNAVDSSAQLVHVDNTGFNLVAEKVCWQKDNNKINQWVIGSDSAQESTKKEALADSKYDYSRSVLVKTSSTVKSPETSSGSPNEDLENIASAENDFVSMPMRDVSGPVLSQTDRTDKDADALLEQVISGQGDKNLGPNVTACPEESGYSLGDVNDEIRSMETSACLTNLRTDTDITSIHGERTDAELAVEANELSSGEAAEISQECSREFCTLQSFGAVEPASLTQELETSDGSCQGTRNFIAQEVNRPTNAQDRSMSDGQEIHKWDQPQTDSYICESVQHYHRDSSKNSDNEQYQEWAVDKTNNWAGDKTNNWAADKANNWAENDEPCPVVESRSRSERLFSSSQQGGDALGRSERGSIAGTESEKQGAVGCTVIDTKLAVSYNTYHVHPETAPASADMAAPDGIVSADIAQENIVSADKGALEDSVSADIKQPDLKSADVLSEKLDPIYLVQDEVEVLSLPDLPHMVLVEVSPVGDSPVGDSTVEVSPVELSPVEVPPVENEGDADSKITTPPSGLVDVTARSSSMDMDTCRDLAHPNMDIACSNVAMSPNKAHNHLNATMSPNNALSHSNVTMSPNKAHSHSNVTISQNKAHSHSKFTMSPAEAHSQASDVMKSKQTENYSQRISSSILSSPETPPAILSLSCEIKVATNSPHFTGVVTTIVGSALAEAGRNINVVLRDQDETNDSTKVFLPLVPDESNQKSHPNTETLFSSDELCNIPTYVCQSAEVPHFPTLSPTREEDNTCQISPPVKVLVVKHLEVSSTPAPAEIVEMSPRCGLAESVEMSPRAGPTESVEMTPRAGPTEAVEMSPRAGPTESVEMCPRAGPTESVEMSPRAGPTESVEMSPRAGPTESVEMSPRAGPTESVEMSPRAGPTESVEMCPRAGPTESVEMCPRACLKESVEVSPIAGPTETVDMSPTMKYYHTDHVLASNRRGECDHYIMSESLGGEDGDKMASFFLEVATDTKKVSLLPHLQSEAVLMSLPREVQNNPELISPLEDQNGTKLILSPADVGNDVKIVSSHPDVQNDTNMMSLPTEIKNTDEIVSLSLEVLSSEAVVHKNDERLMISESVFHKNAPDEISELNGDEKIKATGTEDRAECPRVGDMESITYRETRKSEGHLVVSRDVFSSWEPDNEGRISDTDSELEADGEEKEAQNREVTIQEVDPANDDEDQVPLTFGSSSHSLAAHQQLPGGSGTKISNDPEIVSDEVNSHLESHEIRTGQPQIMVKTGNARKEHGGPKDFESNMAFGLECSQYALECGNSLVGGKHKKVCQEKSSLPCVGSGPVIPASGHVGSAQNGGREKDSGLSDLSADGQQEVLRCEPLYSEGRHSGQALSHEHLISGSRLSGQASSQSSRSSPYYQGKSRGKEEEKLSESDSTDSEQEVGVAKESVSGFSETRSRDSSTTLEGEGRRAKQNVHTSFNAEKLGRESNQGFGAGLSFSRQSVLSNRQDLCPSSKVILDATDAWLNKITSICQSPDFLTSDPDDPQLHDLAAQCKSEIIALAHQPVLLHRLPVMSRSSTSKTRGKCLLSRDPGPSRQHEILEVSARKKSPLDRPMSIPEKDCPNRSRKLLSPKPPSCGNRAPFNNRRHHRGLKEAPQEPLPPYPPAAPRPRVDTSDSTLQTGNRTLDQSRDRIVSDVIESSDVKTTSEKSNVCLQNSENEPSLSLQLHGNQANGENLSQKNSEVMDAQCLPRKQITTECVDTAAASPVSFQKSDVVEKCKQRTRSSNVHKIFGNSSLNCDANNGQTNFVYSRQKSCANNKEENCVNIRKESCEYNTKDNCLYKKEENRLNSGQITCLNSRQQFRNMQEVCVNSNHKTRENSLQESSENSNEISNVSSYKEECENRPTNKGHNNKENSTHIGQPARGNISKENNFQQGRVNIQQGNSVQQPRGNIDQGNRVQQARGNAQERKIIPESGANSRRRVCESWLLKQRAAECGDTRKPKPNTSMGLPAWKKEGTHMGTSNKVTDESRKHFCNSAHAQATTAADVASKDTNHHSVSGQLEANPQRYRVGARYLTATKKTAAEVDPTAGQGTDQGRPLTEQTTLTGERQDTEATTPKEGGNAAANLSRSIMEPLKVKPSGRNKPNKMLTMDEFEQIQKDKHLSEAFARINSSKPCVNSHIDRKYLDKQGPSVKRRRERVNYNCLIALENIKFLEMLRYKKSFYERDGQLEDFKKNYQKMTRMSKHTDQWPELRDGVMVRTRAVSAHCQLKSAQSHA